MGAGYTYSLLLLCIFIKTSIFSSISFCISLKRGFKGSHHPEGLWDSVSGLSLQAPQRVLSISLPQESPPALGEVTYAVYSDTGHLSLPLPHSMRRLNNRWRHEGLVQCLQVSHRPGTVLPELTIGWNYYLIGSMPIKRQNQKSQIMWPASPKDTFDSGVLTPW